MSRIIKAFAAIAVILIIIFPLLVNPYVTQVAITTLCYAMLGLGFAFSQKVGFWRIDIAAWWGIGGYTTALLMGYGMNYWLAALCAGLIAMALGGILFSVVIPRGAMQFFVFCMFFLLLMPSLMPYILALPFLRGGGGGIHPPDIGGFQFISKQSLYYLGLGFLGLTILVYHLLYNSRIGRAWNAIGSGLRLANSLGVDVVKYRMANVLICNFFVALAGAFYVGFYQGTTPLMFGLQTGVLVMVYPMIGGIGHMLLGPVIGAVVTSFLPEYFVFGDEYHIIMTSVLVLLIIIFLPQGLLSVVDRAFKSRRERQLWNARLREMEGENKLADDVLQ